MFDVNQMFQQIPVPAWEQAAIIALFVLMLLALTGAVSKLLKDQRKSQDDGQREMLKMQQEFIEKRDLQYQTFLREQRERDQNSLLDMACNIKELATIIKALTDDFHDHVIREDTTFSVLLDEDQKNKIEHLVKQKKMEKNDNGTVSELVDKP